MIMRRKELMVYNVGFTGAFDSSRRNVSAHSSKEAKEYFSSVFGGRGSVICRHHDVVSLNDHRHCIDWYDAENGCERPNQAQSGRASMVSAGLIEPGQVIV